MHLKIKSRHTANSKLGMMNINLKNMNNDLPKISVLLPVYNTNEKHLRECIESILNQTFKDFELVILNDASTVDLDKIINSYSDSRIRYYKNETNLGITKSRNKLLELAQGKYVAVADHDDISLPKRLEKEYYFLENNPDISLVCGWIECFNEKNGKKKICKFKVRPKYMDIFRGCGLMHPACMWRRSDFEKYNLKYEEGYFGAQDYALFAKAIRYLNFAGLKEIILKYRQHSANASKQKREMALEIDKVKEEMLDFLCSNQKDKELLWNKFFLPETGFIKNIFSVENFQIYKVVRIFGFIFKIKRFVTN